MSCQTRCFGWVFLLTLFTAVHGGLGAEPVANTDIFCFAPPDMPLEAVPKGVLHPKRVMKGVVAKPQHS